MTVTWPSRMDHDTAPYWMGLQDGKLLLGRCRDCQTWIHPPRACCPACWSDDIGHESPSGRATLYSYVIQPTGPARSPEVIGWAELAEQRELFVVAPIIDVGIAAVPVGAKLSLELRERDGALLPAFAVSPESES
jgi:uncharacterized protein